MDQVTVELYNIFHLTVIYSDLEVLLWLIDTCRKRDACLNANTVPDSFSKQTFLKLGELLEKTGKKHYTCFLLAVKLGKYEAASWLIKNHCNLYARNDKLQNALHIATLQGNKSIVELLIRTDSDYNRLRIEKDIKERLPKEFDITGRLTESYFHIWDYAKLGNLEKLKTLVITKEYSINEQTPKKKLSSLHIAVMHKQLNYIKLLVMMGAELNIKNSSGLTPLDLALSSDDYKLETFTIKILRGEEIYPGMMNLKQDLQLTIPTLNPEKIKKVRCNDINDSFCIPKFSGKKSKKNIYKETEHY